VVKFGEVLSTGLNVVHPSTLNLTQNFAENFEFSVFGKVSRQSVGDFGPKCKKAVASKHFVRRPSILVPVPTLSKFTNFQSYLKVLRRSDEAARKYSAAVPETNK